MYDFNKIHNAIDVLANFKPVSEPLPDWDWDFSPPFKGPRFDIHKDIFIPDSLREPYDLEYHTPIYPRHNPISPLIDLQPKPWYNEPVRPLITSTYPLEMNGMLPAYEVGRGMGALPMMGPSPNLMAETAMLNAPPLSNMRVNHSCMGPFAMR